MKKLSVIISLAFVLYACDLQSQIETPFLTEIPAMLPTRVVTSTPVPTKTPILTSTLELATASTLPPTSAYTIGSTYTRHSDGMAMMYVPEGEFTMGNENGVNAEKPEHKVYLDAFWMDWTEVTNAMYSLCVNNGKCSNVIRFSRTPDGYLPPGYHESTEYADYPVYGISNRDAKNYCNWSGGRLPTEAEWEKAARGTDDRSYPWGEDLSCEKANYSGCADFTKPVGSYPNGASLYGLLDMTGNVWEWTADYYQPDFYKDSPYVNPLNDNDMAIFNTPNTILFVTRGGSWNTSTEFVRLTFRTYGTGDGHETSGFRCAKSANP